MIFSAASLQVASEENPPSATLVEVYVLRFGEVRVMTSGGVIVMMYTTIKDHAAIEHSFSGSAILVMLLQGLWYSGSWAKNEERGGAREHEDTQRSLSTVRIEMV